MSDLALRWDPQRGCADLAIEANDIARDDGLYTAVLLSMFLDRRADESDTLPLGETDRRGWWGDAVPVVDGDRVGSKLWMLAREKQTHGVLERAKTYAREALAWLVEDRVAEKVEVEAEFTERGFIAIAPSIYRPALDPVRYRFEMVWGD